MSHQFFFVFLSVVAGCIRYGTYCLSIWKGETRPHVFSWFNWGLMMMIGTYAQYKLGGGVSVWGLGSVAVMCLGISVWALFIGEKDITRSDWAACIGSLVTIILWQLTDNPSTAVTLLISIDVLSYWPTIRKSWIDPTSEPAGSYFWSGLRYFLLLFTVPDMKISTLLYPFWLMATDWGFMAYVFARRKWLKKQAMRTV